jgi:lipopolysaccharide export system protein LptC
MTNSRQLILILAGLIVIAVAIFLSRSASQERPASPPASTNQPVSP